MSSSFFCDLTVMINLYLTADSVSSLGLELQIDYNKINYEFIKTNANIDRQNKNQRFMLKALTLVSL